jgi:hypothetical protein
MAAGENGQSKDGSRRGQNMKGKTPPAAGSPINLGANLGGRPEISVTDADIDKIRTMSGYGLTQNMMADILGWSEDTFTRRKQDDPRVARALRQGRSTAAANVGEALYNKATGSVRYVDGEGKVYRRPPETSAIRWYEISRLGYKDRIVVEGDPENPVQAEVKGMSTAEKVSDLLGVLAKYRRNGNGNGRRKPARRKGGHR